MRLYQSRFRVVDCFFSAALALQAGLLFGRGPLLTISGSRFVVCFGILLGKLVVSLGVGFFLGRSGGGLGFFGFCLSALLHFGRVGFLGFTSALTSALWRLPRQR